MHVVYNAKSIYTHSQSSIFWAPVWVQIRLPFLFPFCQPPCIHAIKESVKHLAKFASLLKLLISNKIKCTAD